MAAAFDSSSSFSTLPLASDPSYRDILSPLSPPPPPPENISSPKPGSEEGPVVESDHRSENLKPSESMKSQSKRRLRKKKRPTSCLDIDNYEIGDIRSALTIDYGFYYVDDSDDDDDDDDDAPKRGKEDKPIDPPDNDDHDDHDVVPPTRSPTIIGKRRPSDDDTKDPESLNDDDHIDDDDHDGRPDEKRAEALILKPGMFNCGVCGSLDHPCLLCPYWHHLPPNPKIGPDFQLACDLCGRCGDKVTEACKFLRLVHKTEHGL